MIIADDLAVEAKIHAKQAGYSAIAGAKQAGNSAASGVREFGTEFLKQMLGHSGTTPPVSDDDLAKKQAVDDEKSKQEYLDLRAKVAAIYSDQRVKSQKQEQLRQQEVQVKQEKILDDLNQKRQMRADVATAVGKNSAETGRSWGAE